MSEEVAIKVEDLNKEFKLPQEKHSSLKSMFVNVLGSNRSFERQKVLQDISFEIKKGEFFGIVGRNGSGKSTLLKLLATIYSPTTGAVAINGKLTPFIELGVGFNPELTGRENVFLNGALLGFDRKEMQAMYEDIVEFAELEKFMDQKLKNYSSGMQVRLAFSIAIRAESDILLIDEVLAVGDEAFQRKCFKYFDKLKKEARTVVFVTHDMASFEKYCDSGVLIDSGKIIYKGEPRLIAAEYKMLNTVKPKKVTTTNNQLSFEDTIKEVKLNGKKRAVIDHGENLGVEVSVTSSKSVSAVAGISIVRSDGVYAAFHNSRKDLGRIQLKANELAKFSYNFKSDQFIPGVYYIDIALYDNKGGYIDLKSQMAHFVILGEDHTRAGIINLQGEWSFNE